MRLQAKADRVVRAVKRRGGSANEREVRQLVREARQRGIQIGFERARKRFAALAAKTKVTQPSSEQPISLHYRLGREAGLHGPDVANTSFKLFDTPEHTREWERGKADGAALQAAAGLKP